MRVRLETVSFQILTVAVVVSPFGLLMVISFSWEVMTWRGRRRRRTEGETRHRECTFRTCRSRWVKMGEVPENQAEVSLPPSGGRREEFSCEVQPRIYNVPSTTVPSSHIH